MLRPKTQALTSIRLSRLTRSVREVRLVRKAAADWTLTEARSTLVPLARAPCPLHHRRCAAPSSGLAAQAHGAPNPGSYDEVQSGTLAPCYSSPDSCCPTIVVALSSPRPPCSLFTHSYDAMPTLERLGRPCMQHARRGRKATAACEEDKSQLRFVQHSVVVSAISWHGLLSLLLLSHPLRRNACDCTADAPGTVQGRKPEAATCEWSPDQTGVCRMRLHHCSCSHHHHLHLHHPRLCPR